MFKPAASQPTASRSFSFSGQVQVHQNDHPCPVHTYRLFHGTGCRTGRFKFFKRPFFIHVMRKRTNSFLAYSILIYSNNAKMKMNGYITVRYYLMIRFQIDDFLFLTDDYYREYLPKSFRCEFIYLDTKLSFNEHISVFQGNNFNMIQ